MDFPVSFNTFGKHYHHYSTEWQTSLKQIRTHLGAQAHFLNKHKYQNHHHPIELSHPSFAQLKQDLLKADIHQIKHAVFFKPDKYIPPK